MMAELYKEYLNEILGGLVIESPHGFIVYKINGEYCELIDTYVRGPARGTGVAKLLLQRLVSASKESKCRAIRGRIYEASRTREKTLERALRAGCKIESIEQGRITLIKEL